MILRILSTIFLFQVILSAIFTQLLTVDLRSFGLGGLISFINFTVLAYLWLLIIYKKRVVVIQLFFFGSFYGWTTTGVH